MQPSRSLLAILLLGLAPAAHAEWTVATLAGLCRTRSSDLSIRQPTSGTSLRFDDVTWDDRSFEGPIYYVVRGGFTHRRVGWDVELTHYKVRATTSRTVRATGTLQASPMDQDVVLDSIVHRFELSHGVNALVGAVTFRQRHGRVTALERAGAGVIIPHAESDILGKKHAAYELADPVVEVSVGGEFKLTRRLDAVVEAKLTHVDASVDVPDGTGSATLDSAHLAFGIAIHGATD
jgi:hypothetical protein